MFLFYLVDTNHSYSYFILLKFEIDDIKRKAIAFYEKIVNKWTLLIAIFG